MKTKKQTRQEWIENAARTFFQTKEKQKKYMIDIYYPEVDISDYVFLSEEEIKQYKDFINNEYQSFLREKDSYISDNFKDWLRDAFMDANFTLGIRVPEYIDAEVQFVDLDDYINTYRFDVNYFAYDNIKKIYKGVRYVNLSDEDYIRLLCECIDYPHTTMNDIAEKYPDIHKLIVTTCDESQMEYAIFLTELKEDAKNIREAAGDQIPD